MENEVAKGSFGVAVKAAIVDGSRLLVLYKTTEEALGDPDPAIRVDLPGGRVRFGESPIEALRREYQRARSRGDTRRLPDAVGAAR